MGVVFSDKPRPRCLRALFAKGKKGGALMAIFAQFPSLGAYLTGYAFCNVGCSGVS